MIVHKYINLSSKRWDSDGTEDGYQRFLYTFKKCDIFVYVRGDLRCVKLKLTLMRLQMTIFHLDEIISVSFDKSYRTHYRSFCLLKLSPQRIIQLELFINVEHHAGINMRHVSNINFFNSFIFQYLLPPWVDVIDSR